MWKDIQNWEDLYEVSDTGEVRNKLSNNLLVGDINNAGYYRVCLYNKNHIPPKQRFFRHRLVAKHFIDNHKNLPQVNHIDGDKSNNSMNNLEWVSPKENEIHSRKVIGVKEYKPFAVVFDNGKTIVCNSKSELSNEIGLTKTSIKEWLHKGNTGYFKRGIKDIYYI